MAYIIYLKAHVLDDVCENVIFAPSVNLVRVGMCIVMSLPIVYNNFIHSGLY